MEHNERKEIILEAHTFGGTRAAEVLAEMLNNDDNKKHVRLVCSLWTKYSQGLHELERGMKNSHFRHKFISLWFEHCKNDVEKSELNDKYKSYLMNLEKTLIRKIKREEKGVVV